VRSDEPIPRDKIDLVARTVIAKELGHTTSRLPGYLGLGYCVDFKRPKNKEQNKRN
jgi:hypothetical protein